MLTKDDLGQIKTVVEDVVDQKLKPIEKRLGGVEKRLGGVENRLGGVEKRLNKLEKGQKEIIKHFDNQDIKLEERVERIESHLHLSAPATF